MCLKLLNICSSKWSCDLVLLELSVEFMYEGKRDNKNRNVTVLAALYTIQIAILAGSYTHNLLV